VIGYEYIPGAQVTFPRPGGGFFRFTVNSAGIRSDREYSYAKPPGVYRILAFGDSQAGGAAQSNDIRFSELIELRNPGLEVINFALPGSGTDQQLLVFEHVGYKYDFAVIILLPFLSNIQRNVMWSQRSVDPRTQRVRSRPKPRFELQTHEDGTEELVLRNVPVSEDPQDSGELSDREAASHLIDGLARWSRRAWNKGKKLISPLLRRLDNDSWPLFDPLRHEPYREYRSRHTPEWMLMAAITRRFIDRTRPKPFVIVPIVDSSYVHYSTGRSYWRRFTSLADGKRVHTIDLLAHFLKLGRHAKLCYLPDHNPHLSDLGHSVLADVIVAELTWLGLSAVRSSRSRAANRAEGTSATVRPRCTIS
jgi:hypothetical protein